MVVVVVGRLLEGGSERGPVVWGRGGVAVSGLKALSPLAGSFCKGAVLDWGPKRDLRGTLV